MAEAAPPDLSNVTTFDVQSINSSSSQSLLDGKYSSISSASGDSGSPVESQNPNTLSSSLTWLSTDGSLPDLAAPSDSSIHQHAEADSRGFSFPAKIGHHHATWAHTFYSHPELLAQPRNVQDVQRLVLEASRRRKRIVTVGSGHSPSDLTCTSSWMVDLSVMNKIFKVTKVDHETSSPIASTSSSQSPRASPTAGRVLFQAGISLDELNHVLDEQHGLTIPNLGSIAVQSLAGAIATGTHGSSLAHGILSQNVTGLRIVLADGRAIWCSAVTRVDLFRAALVSLGALGIITEMEMEVSTASNIEWTQKLMPLEDALATWDKDLWTQCEFIRCWWMPYTRRMIHWSAERTDKPLKEAPASWYGGALGYYIYLNLLWFGHHVPRTLPWVEWFVFGMQYGFQPGFISSAVAKQREGLLMDCLFSQFVNEWALPLSKGPEAIRRLSKWLHREEGSGIPFETDGIYVHCPIEVRVSNGIQAEGKPRAFLDPTRPTEPTLYLNATMYRPYNLDPPGKTKYYRAFEWLMKDLGGRPHWAKNFETVTNTEFRAMYGKDMERWLDVRKEVDENGLFIGSWHRRNLLGNDIHDLKNEEKKIWARKRWIGGIEWSGRIEA